MNSINKIKNPFLLFSPFLFFYLGFIFIMYKPGLIGDESRFLNYAKNLSHGFYSTGYPNINLISPPGYPILITPFVVLHLPKICIIILNALLHYLSVVFLFKALLQFTTIKKSIVISLFWGFYYVAYQNMVRIAYEPLSFFLAAMLVFSLLNSFKQPLIRTSRFYIILSGFILGYLALTKVIFAPIIFVMFAACLLLFIINKKVVNYKKAVIILVIAFLTFAPYLVYTYNLTGRAFYLGNGSDNLYWMSTPYEGEYGDWKGALEINPIENGNYNIPGAADTLVSHHQNDYNEIKILKGLEKDDAFKRIAINNIRYHPLKYAQNIFFNFGRLFFHYPFSQAIQRPKPLFVMPMNGIILTFILISLIPTLIHWRKILFPIRFMVLIAVLYLGGSSLIAAETRMFTTIVPILLVWIAYIIQKTINIKHWGN